MASSSSSSLPPKGDLDTTTDAPPNRWSEYARLYADQSTNLTELHGGDLVALLKDDIIRATTILDVGAGTGAFAKAYVRQFPRGIPNQTLIVSDMSVGMVEKARETIHLPPDFQTRVVFQVEDGTKLDGIDDDSVDVVVSLFGVSLIPDQEATIRAIRRVLRKPNGVFGNGSWMFDKSKGLVSQGFGVSLQDAFLLANKGVLSASPSEASPKVSLPSVFGWATRESVKTKLLEEYQLGLVNVSCALHTCVLSFEPMWTMMVENPMSAIAKATMEDQQRAKDALKAFVESDGFSSVDRPLLLSSVSILAIGRGVNASGV